MNAFLLLIAYTMSILSAALWCQDKHERLERLKLKKKVLKEQDEYESVDLEQSAAGPYSGPVR